MILEDRALIIIGCKHSQWKLQRIFSHKQMIHSRLTNMSGYVFDLSIVYEEQSSVAKKELWEKIVEATQILDGGDWLLGAWGFQRNPQPNCKRWERPL